MGTDTFEAREGWVPANTEGSVWCYRTRGNAGVIAFRRNEDGQYLYEATHQDCYSSDETITTPHRVDAVRFATAGAAAAAPPAASSDTPSQASDRVELPVAPSRVPGGARDALRAAWHQYIHATSELVKHVKGNLDATAQSELLGTADQALAFVRGSALDEPFISPDDVDVFSVAIHPVLRKAHELIASDPAGERAEL